MGLTYHVEKFGDGKVVWLYSPVIRCTFTTLGAAIQSVKIWNAQAKRWIEVNCGYPCPKEAEADTDYMGPTVGRYAGRINNGTFELDNKTYHVSRNMNNQHTIHGGTDAFNKRHWSFMPVETPHSVGVRFSLASPHLDQGFPAELDAFVYYYIEAESPNTLHTTFSAHIPSGSPADATVVNIFNHAYWNLNGVPSENTASNPRWTQPEKVHNIHLKLPCSKVAETDSAAIPTGKLKSVEGTCLDFRRGKPLGDNIDNNSQLKRDPCGYDHPLCVDGWKPKGKKLLLNAEAYSPTTRIQMKVYSTFPSVWLYTANNKSDNATGEKGQRYGRYTAVCIEPQYLPDSPNHPEFPSTVVRKSHPYFEKMVNEFNVITNSNL